MKSVAAVDVAAADGQITQCIWSEMHETKGKYVSSGSTPYLW